MLASEKVEYLLEVITMQQIFYTSVSPEEYQRLGENLELISAL